MAMEEMIRDEIQEFEVSCLHGSFLLRLRKADSRWLIRTAISYLPKEPWKLSLGILRLLQTNLKDLLKRDIRDTYGNPFVIFILLRIILPIVLRLVFEWWLNRRDTSEEKLDWIW
jgi:hypothetical protein